ncbi:carboxymuconolactone decarboxylase family protein [Marinobacterium weihaiense]|uniref:Carboxymuconolactone decarboxylase family protein n=1 Tax=Marinobacterium weihaiense TaxID=2851016 RepID=A0ABS6M8M4_9GAMM|nr:carboxymuconolactone decarboxylase family protein [Marinobacterium weihaiense]MBV0932535.1 carboxymuconolactone decarboxylase family protein [Marinobacterium weihaiense]
MSRMPMLCPETACEQGAPTLKAIRGQLGMLPNFFAGLANHGAALNGYLAFEESLSEHSRLTAAQREMISLAIANANGCHYCVSGHTLSAKHVGVDAEAARQAQQGQATDPVDQAILDFALDVLEQRGHLPDESLNAARQMGLDDAALVEITSWVGLNSYSNWVNNLIQPKIDFPEVPLID